MPAARLFERNEQLLAVPEGFTVNPKLARQLERRRETVHEGGVDWGEAGGPGVAAPAAGGFEDGYSVAAPDSLVLWEAQFGDFVNGAQIVVDQCITAGLSKWGQTSRLTLLLPHGYEGNGPEHSSARLERFLQLAAQENIRIANCSTAAQHFHLLPRQGLAPGARPPVAVTPEG